MTELKVAETTTWMLPTPVRTITYRVLLLDLKWRLRTGSSLM